MDWLYFTKFSIHGITQLLMALMITGYLCSVPNKSKLFLRSGLDRPLGELLSGVRKVNEGDPDVTVPAYVEDEIGFVARSFDLQCA